MVGAQRIVIDFRCNLPDCLAHRTNNATEPLPNYVFHCREVKHCFSHQATDACHANV